MNNEELVRPVMKGGIMRDEMGNPPGTIYFLENPIEWFKNKFFGKKPEIIPEPIPEPIPEVVPEKTFEELIAEKLDQVFNCNHLCCFRPMNNCDRGFYPEGKLNDLIIHKQFRYKRYNEGYYVEIYDAKEPELIENVYKCELRGTFTFIFGDTIHKSKMYRCYYNYKSGIWDESFLECLNELASIKIDERTIVMRKLMEKQEQDEINRKLAEEVKQERIRKMFEKNP